MTCRTIQNKSIEGYEEDCYLFYFDNERKYSIAQRKLITCEDDELVVGAKLKVKDGAKFFIGSLLNIGKRTALENVLRIQESMLKTPDTKVVSAKSKQKEGNRKRQRSPTSDNEPSLLSSDDSDIYGSKEKTCRRSVESDSDILTREQEKVKRLKKVIQNKEINKDKNKQVLKERLERLERTVDELFKSVEEIKKTMRNSRPASVSPMQEGKIRSSPHEKVMANENPDTAIWHNDINLMTINAPPKEPSKCAIKLLSRLFSVDELENGILFQSKRSTKPALDPTRVTKLFDVLNARYGEERVQKTHQVIVDACNQKCRDVRRKSKTTIEKESTNAEQK